MIDNRINGVTNLNKGIIFSEDKLVQPKVVYFIPSYACNLNCPHCTIWKRKQEYDYDKLLYIAQYIKDTDVVLFGGEPLLNQDLFLHQLITILKDNNCNVSMSTNLVTYKYFPEGNFYQDISLRLDVLKRLDSISTSYNPGRFNAMQRLSWENNLKILRDNDIPYSIMVTLTPELTKVKIKDFYEYMQQHTYANTPIKFDNFVGPITSSQVQDIDNWLCNLYNEAYDTSMYSIFTQISGMIYGNSQWGDICNNVYSILPNGNIKEGCPYYEKYEIKEECMDCDFNKYCVGGCCIQPTCTFPKKLFKKIYKKIKGKYYG